MNQILHIFRKDVRRHWPEILASFALVVAYAWVEIREWHQREMAFVTWNVLYGVLSQFARPLLFISWMFLIVRAVQGESLVGDRQFWVTRPYEWKKLLISKGLFVLCFVNLPLFLVNLYLLARAGFHPTLYVRGILHRQLILALSLLLPTAALAAVTAGIGQMLLTLLFIVSYVIGASALLESIPHSNSGEITTLQSALWIGTTIVVLLLQYSRRKTFQSRGLIVALGAVLVLIAVLTPTRNVMAKDYPLPAELPLQLIFKASPPAGPEKVNSQTQDVMIRLNFNLSGLPPDAFAQLNGAILNVTNSTGGSWDSGWTGYGMHIFPDLKVMGLNFSMKRSDFDRLKASPVNARLQLAFTEFHDENPRPFVVPGGEFALPELGFCYAGFGYWNRLSCRAALDGPNPFILITTDMGASTCPLQEGVTRPTLGEMAREIFRGGGRADGISPIVIYEIDPTGSKIETVRTRPGICSGTQLIFSHPRQVRRGRMELHFDNLQLADYRLKPQGDGGAIIGVFHEH